MDVEDRDGWHLVTIVGRWDSTTADEINKEMAQRLFAMRAKRILIDARRMSVHTTAGEEFFIAGRLGALGASRAVRVAGVMAEDPGEHRFYELAVQNAGVNFRLFTDYDAALAWIRAD
jgi:hypothetical protein